MLEVQAHGLHGCFRGPGGVLPGMIQHQGVPAAVLATRLDGPVQLLCHSNEVQLAKVSLLLCCLLPLGADGSV